MPNQDEKLMIDYVLLAVIHDGALSDPTDDHIYFRHEADAAFNDCDEWALVSWADLSELNAAAEYHEGDKIRGKIERALQHVKADLARGEQSEETHIKELKLSGRRHEALRSFVGAVTSFLSQIELAVEQNKERQRHLEDCAKSGSAEDIRAEAMGDGLIITEPLWKTLQNEYLKFKDAFRDLRFCTPDEQRFVSHVVSRTDTIMPTIKANSKPRLPVEAYLSDDKKHDPEALKDWKYRCEIAAQQKEYGTPEKTEQALEVLRRIADISRRGMLSLTTLRVVGNGTETRKPAETKRKHVTRKEKRNNDQYILRAALLQHHGFGSGGLNYQPITQPQLVKKLGWTQSKVHRMMKDIFGEHPMDKYKRGCRKETLTGFLKKLDNDTCEVEAVANRSDV
ncbi:MAG: hypothetical protein ACYTEQ_11560 [Planctomycetota bacterium]